ncbi:hypothetical protein GCM10010406_51640 [Streptomyces thermolineatus]|uniref:Uncharacterized protein n=1 Tax=Streptomyces thermolineatus TaxID=44033 RepID=A0ABP6A5S6_9ACTN
MQFVRPVDTDRPTWAVYEGSRYPGTLSAVLVRSGGLLPPLDAAASTGRWHLVSGKTSPWSSTRAAPHRSPQRRPGPTC